MGSRRSITRALVVLSAATVLAAAACGADTVTTPGTAPGGGAIDPAAALATAKQATEAGLKGTNRPVDATSRPAVKGKKVAVIASSMDISSSKIPAEGTIEAAKAAGWDTMVLDAKLDASKYSDLVRQATAAEVDGIVLVAIDCAGAKTALEEAKAAGIAITSVYAYDCNDPRAGQASAPTFAVNTNFGPDVTAIADFTKKYGADQAAYIVAESNNQAKIILVNAPEFTVLNYTADGFKAAIEQSGSSEIVSVLDVTQADIMNQQLRPKIEAELQRHPEATWIKSPFTFVTTGGIVPALTNNTTGIKVMGGEGFSEELDLLREGKIHAVNVISSAWNGWAAIDSLNSHWSQKAPVDSGIGWTLVDKDHGLPASGEFIPPVDFKAAYKKAWGAG